MYENPFWCCYEDEGGVAGEGKLVGVPKFHSWGKCTYCAINEYSVDWMSNASFGPCIILNKYCMLVLIIKPKTQLETSNEMHR